MHLEEVAHDLRHHGRGLLGLHLGGRRVSRCKWVSAFRVLGFQGFTKWKMILALHAMHFHYNKDKIPNGKGSTSSRGGGGRSGGCGECPRVPRDLRERTRSSIRCPPASPLSPSSPLHSWLTCDCSRFRVSIPVGQNRHLEEDFRGHYVEVT